MLRFTDCKINIGLDIVRKRPDGYHDIVTAMVHVPWHDVLEVVPINRQDDASGNDALSLTVLGNAVDCPPEKNLVVKAYSLMQELYGVPDARIILKKVVPDGAGLGGGSGDAAAMVLLVNDMYGLGLDRRTMADIAGRLGADCPFFIYDTPMLATGTGTTLQPIDLDLHGYHLVIAKRQGISISTAQAYAGTTPREPEQPLTDLLALPVDQWMGRVKNDFEESIFPIAPELRQIKAHMIGMGATYAAMTGSGCAVYGLFDNPELATAARRALGDCVTFMCPL